MDENYQIDRIDAEILKILQTDARVSLSDIARKLKLATGTIHQRFEKLKEKGLVLGSTLNIDYKKLGKKVEVILGIHLKSAKDFEITVPKLEKLKEIVEVYYTTGSFSLIVKIVVRDIDDFHRFLTKELQNINEIRATESFICLNTLIKREVAI